MKLDDWASSADVNDIYADVRKLGLEPNVSELDAFGFTVIPPELVAPREFHEELRDALLGVHKQRTGQKITDLTSGRTGTDGPSSAHSILMSDNPIFPQAVMNPTVFTMARYLCGQSVVLSELFGMLKNQDDTPTHMLHTDQQGTPAPFPPYSQIANVTWTLSDYTPDNGPLAIVPGSHKHARRPNPYEANFLAPDAPVTPIPVECEAGSLIIWHGATWHASYPRKAPGLRANLILVIARAYMRPFRDFSKDTPEEIYADNPDLARLLGVENPYPSSHDAVPNIDRIKRYLATSYNQWA